MRRGKWEGRDKLVYPWVEPFASGVWRPGGLFQVYAKKPTLFSSFHFGR